LLKSGESMKGTLLEISDADFVLEDSLGKHFVPRSLVEEVQRKLPKGFLGFFSKQASKAKSLDDWTRLANFCKSKKARPERRQCHRRILEIDPGNQTAHLDLGEALLDGKWLQEREVEAKKKAGFTVVKGKLVPPRGKKAGGGEGSQEGEEPQEEPEDVPGPGGPAPGRKGTSIEEEYVRERLEKLLRATQSEFLSDGRIRLVYGLKDKNKDQSDIFTPKVGEDPESTFRWTLKREEEYTGYTGSTYKLSQPGIRVANSGLAFLNCWFQDDVEVEVDFCQAVSFSRTQTMALIYGPDKAHLVCSNFGSQCITSIKGKRAEKKGTLEPCIFDNVVKLKLAVRKGKYKALKEGREKAEASYPSQGFQSGRVGILWGGAAAGVLSRLEIVGRLDYKKMAEELRSQPK